MPINACSLEEHQNSMIETGFREICTRAPWPQSTEGVHIHSWLQHPETVRFQAMRVAYYCVDQSCSKESITLNRIVSLKEDRNKV